MSLCEAIFGPDPYADAKAFYGPATFQALLKYETEQREWARIKAETAPDRVDDVAWQLEARPQRVINLHR